MIGLAETTRTLCPDHLALCSWLHAGPRPPLEEARALELGGDWGFHSLVLARCDPNGTYVGIATSSTAVAAANAKARRLGLTNAHFFTQDWAEPGGSETLTEPFDYVLAPLAFARSLPEHWGSVLGYCRSVLRRDGLLYVDYKTRPGWTVRGLVSELLGPPTAQISDPAQRRRAAQALAEEMRQALPSEPEHVYQSLLAAELERFIVASPESVHGEYFAADPPIYFGDFIALAEEQGLVHVANADFNTRAGRFPQAIDIALADIGFAPVEREQLGDLLCNRVRRRSVLCRRDCKRRPVLTAKSSRQLLVGAARETVAADSVDKTDLLTAAILGALEGAERDAAGCDALPFDAFHERAAALLRREDPAAQIKSVQLFTQLVALYRIGALELSLRVPAVALDDALREIAQTDPPNDPS